MAIDHLRATNKTILTRSGVFAGVFICPKKGYNFYMKEIKRHYRMDRRQIAYFRFILEGYDGLAILRTLDPAQGRVVLYLSRSCEPELDELLEGISDQLRLEAVPAPAGQGVDSFEQNHG
jgi:hypothetical protein